MHGAATLARPPAAPRPAPRTGPALWRGEALSPADWMLAVGVEATQGLDEALDALDGRAPGAASEAPLPRLAPLLSTLAQRLDRGIGFALLRGLPADRVADPARAGLLLRVLGLQVGAPLPGPDGATHHALLCLRPPPAARDAALVSVAAVHNRLLVGGGGGLPADPRAAEAALAVACAEPGLALTVPLRPGDVLLHDGRRVWRRPPAGGTDPALLVLALRTPAEAGS